LKTPLQTPFDSVENAHQYIHLLVEAIAEARAEVAADVEAAASRPDRRLEALRVVQFKLDKLEQHLKTSSRLLNDLRSLRRLLFDERPEPSTADREPAA
jgi:formiminotetrahydrofolate cyclodeaminase